MSPLVDELHLENALDDLLLHPPQAHQRLLWVEENNNKSEVNDDGEDESTMTMMTSTV